MNAVLFSVAWLQSLGKDLPNYHTRELDSDMSFTYWMRRQVCKNFYDLFVNPHIIPNTYNFSVSS